MPRPVTKLQDIEAAGVKLFASRGVGRVTIKDIAREAGCAEGALYRHYSGMEEMAWSLYKREVEKFGARVREVLLGPGSYSRRVRDSIGLFYRFFDSDPVTFGFILLAEHHFAIERKVDPRLSPEKLVFTFVRQGARDGAFQVSDKELAAAMVLGIVLMPATLRAVGMLKGPMNRQISGATQACLNVLAPRRRR